MKTLKIYPTSINERAVAEAVATLHEGGIVVYPTDTIYAIGCDATNNNAVKRVCAIKGIDPKKQRLSVVCADLSQASEYARIDNSAYRRIKDYLPGPFTFVLPAATTLPKEFKGRKEVGVRVPDNAVARALAREMGNPLLSASIDWDEEYPDEAIDPDAIALRYGNVADVMIDGGPGHTGGSTVVNMLDPSDPEILRPGVGEFL